MSFRAGLKVLLAARPRWDLTKEQTLIWSMLLSDIPDDALLASAVQYARELKYPEPQIGDWRERALSMLGAGRAGVVTHGDAWNELMRNRAIVARERYESRAEKRTTIVWSSEAARLAAESVDWRGNWTGESVATTRAQFREAFRAMQDKHAAIDSAKAALEFAPRVEALLAGPILRRIEDKVPA